MLIILIVLDIVNMLNMLQASRRDVQHVGQGLTEPTEGTAGRGRCVGRVGVLVDFSGACDAASPQGSV